MEYFSVWPLSSSHWSLLRGDQNASVVNSVKADSIARRTPLLRPSQTSSYCRAKLVRPQHGPAEFITYSKTNLQVLARINLTQNVCKCIYNLCIEFGTFSLKPACHYRVARHAGSSCYTALSGMTCCFVLFYIFRGKVKLNSVNLVRLDSSTTFEKGGFGSGAAMLAGPAGPNFTCLSVSKLSLV